MTPYPRPQSLRELSRELGLPKPEAAILADAIDHLEVEWGLDVPTLRRALTYALDAVPRSDADLTAVTDGPEAAHVLLKALGHEDCVPRSEIEKPADVLNSRDAVTEGDEELWDRSPGDALAKAMAEILDESVVMSQTAAHQSRRAERAERERDAAIQGRDDWRRRGDEVNERRKGVEADNERLREALAFYEASFCDGGEKARAALSADADADAKPSRTHSRSGQPIKHANVADGGVMGDIVPCHECGSTGELHDPHELPEDAEPQDTEPSRAEGDETERFQDLIERSSLGTPAAKRLRSLTDDETARRIVERANELSREGDEWRVTLDEIDRQRERGWPDFHPEDYCHRCGAPNPSWSVDSDRFNTAMGDPGSHRWQGIVCVGCFVRLHEAATGLTCTWRLVPETPFQAAEGGRPHEAENARP